MKIFKLLWVDDEEANVEVMREYLTEWVSTQTGGQYYLEIEERRTYDDTIITIANDPFINMVISDLNLLGEKSGAEMIKLIRANEVYKDVLLYSSDASELRKAIADLDGIHYFSFADIMTLREKIRNTIHQSLYREQYAHARYEHYYNK